MKYNLSSSGESHADCDRVARETRDKKKKEKVRGGRSGSVWFEQVTPNQCQRPEAIQAGKTSDKFRYIRVMMTTVMTFVLRKVSSLVFIPIHRETFCYLTLWAQQLSQIVSFSAALAAVPPQPQLQLGSVIESDHFLFCKNKTQHHRSPSSFHQQRRLSNTIRLAPPRNIQNLHSAPE